MIVRDSQIAARWVWSCWGVLTLITGGLVLWYGIPLPFSDEWEAIVPFITGERAVTWAALWAPHNEHRIVVPRLVLLALDRLTGHEFRAGMVLNVVLLSATSACLLIAVRRIRGHWVWADAFFPALLVNWAHVENLIWSFQVQFVLVACLSSGALAAIVVERPSPQRMTLLALLLGFLPLCSAAGIVLCAAFAPLFVVFVLQRHRPLSEIVVAGLLLVALVTECVLMYVPRDAIHPPPANLAGLVRHAILECGMVLGPVVRTAGFIASGVCLALSAASVWWLARGRDTAGTQWFPRFGLALAIGGHLALAAAIAWGRSGLGDRSVLAVRYCTLLCPLLIGVYLAADRFASERWNRLVPAGLCAAQILLYPANVIGARDFANTRRTNAINLVHEIERQVPAAELIRRHEGQFSHLGPVFATQVRRLRDARIGIFAKIPADPPNERVVHKDDYDSSAQKR